MQGLMAQACLQFLSYIREMEALKRAVELSLVHRPFSTEADTYILHLKTSAGLTFSHIASHLWKDRILIDDVQKKVPMVPFPRHHHYKLSKIEEGLCFPEPALGHP